MLNNFCNISHINLQYNHSRMFMAYVILLSFTVIMVAILKHHFDNGTIFDLKSNLKSNLKSVFKSGFDKYDETEHAIVNAIKNDPTCIEKIYIEKTLQDGNSVSYHIGVYFNFAINDIDSIWINGEEDVLLLHNELHHVLNNNTITKRMLKKDHITYISNYGGKYYVSTDTYTSITTDAEFRNVFLDVLNYGFNVKKHKRSDCINCEHHMDSVNRTSCDMTYY